MNQDERIAALENEIAALKKEIASLNELVKDAHAKIDAHKDLIADNAKKIEKNSLSIIQKMEKAAIKEAEESPYN